MTALAALLMGLGIYLVWLSCFDRLKKPIRKESPTATLLQQAGIRNISPRVFYLLCCLLTLVLGLIMLSLTHLYHLAALTALTSFFLPRILIRRSAKKRQAALGQQWPDVVDHLHSAVRAGLSLPEALIQLQYRGPDPLRSAFQGFAADYRSSGEFVASLNRLKDHLADPTADTLVEALKITREVGGNDLGCLLDTLSEFLRESSRIRAELEARQSWTINAAKLAVLAPWVVLCLMATQPATVQVYNSFAGCAVMLGGLTISCLAYRMMLKIASLPQQRRVLT